MNIPDMPFLKKIDAVVLVFMLSTLMFGVSAQEKVENRGILQQMRDLFSGSSLLERDLVGGWEYRRTACMFETENLLKKAGGAVVASQVEKTFDEYCTRIGIKDGKCEFTFKEDSTYTAKLGLLKFSGKFRVDEKGKILSMSYLQGLGSVKAYPIRSRSGLKLLFDADGFLQMMKTASMFTKNNSVEVLAAMADLYDGMLLGFDLELKKGQ